MSRSECNIVNIESDNNILYEDTDILVCIKPAGIACETKNVCRQDMVSRLRNYRSKKGEDTYIGLIHRLDQPVEGILVFAKNTESAAALSRQLRQGIFTKIYLAVTLGVMPAREGRLQDYLKKDSRSNTSYVTDANDQGAKKSVLLYQVLKTDYEQETVQNLVRIELLTGRHHQIRVQMANLGTPVAGDLKYGGSVRENVLKLCACELSFMHPVTKKEMKYQIEPSWDSF